MEITGIIDAKDLFCPIHLLKTKKELAKMKSGQVLQIDVTDLNSRDTFIDWCERSKNEYLGEKESNGFVSFFIRKSL